MLKSLAGLAVVCLLCAPSASADVTEPTRSVYRQRSIALAGQELVNNVTGDQFRTSSAQGVTSTQARSRSFIKRRPVLSGMLIGMAAGTAIAAAAGGNEVAFIGFYGGSAVGAAAGWALSR